MRKGARHLALAVAATAALLGSGAGAASSTLAARGSIELAFSPADDPEAALLRVIEEARESLHVQAYVFTLLSAVFIGMAIHAHH